MDRKPRARKHAPAWEDRMSQAEFMKKYNLVMEGDEDGDDDDDDDDDEENKGKMDGKLKAPWEDRMKKHNDTVLEPEMKNADELSREMVHVILFFVR